jgi:Holliday junction resolvasome RuvABC DNA-binding subunit
MIVDQVVLEGEAQLYSMRKERRRLFNDLLGVKGACSIILGF